MTKKECRAYGYAFGVLEAYIEKVDAGIERDEDYDDPSENISFANAAASVDPARGFALIYEVAMDYGVLPSGIRDKVAYAFEVVEESVDDEDSQELSSGEMLVGWMTGCRRGRAGLPFDKTIAEEILSIRKRFGMSQTVFAKELGCTQPEVSRWERGDIEPNDITLQKIREMKADNGAE